MKKHKDADDDILDPDFEEFDDTKSKREIRIEKHARLLDYMEAKRLREELDVIEGW